MAAVPRTELHRHLDISLRPATLLQLAQERGLEPLSTSVAQFHERFFLRKPLTDLDAVLAHFRLFQQVLDRPEVLERVAFEVIEDCRAEGTRQVELRFSPSFVCELSEMKWADALAGFSRGLSRALNDYPEMRAGLICIGTRDLGVESVEETVDFFLAHRSSFIGMDLAGSETAFPCHLFQNAFRRVREAGAPITIHAGEATGPENMWEAIELLGARRIGHGIACVRDPVLLKTLAERKICLEVCPTSNWLTQCVRSLSEHPLPQILRAGVPVCINTDDPGVFPVTLPSEEAIAQSQMGLTPADLAACQQYAAQSTFL